MIKSPRFFALNSYHPHLPATNANTDIITNDNENSNVTGHEKNDDELTLTQTKGKRGGGGSCCLFVCLDLILMATRKMYLSGDYM
jgi:hypothetical protein